MGINLHRAAALSQEALLNFPQFSSDVFVLFLNKISRKYTDDRQIFWEAMRDSANELELKGNARKVYKSMAGKYFAENRRIRAKKFKPNNPPKESPRRLILGEIVLEGSQLAWRI